MPAPTATDLYHRGADTLVASWEQYARASRDAAVIRAPGVAAAVFRAEPERAVYNNALLERGLGDAAGGVALDALEEAYAAAGVARYAAWVHESEAPLRAALQERGYALDATTRAMGMALTDIRVARPEIEQAPPAWAAYLRFLAADGVPEGLLAAAARGCRTATIQSTPMAERVYAAVGFRDLGRFLEYVPADR